MTDASAFHNQRYIVLETYRKNGTPVVTPLGFVQDGAVLYARTPVNSGKVKRLRANQRVRIAPGTGGGQPLGAWIEATVIILPEAESPEIRAKILAKYRLIWILLETVDSVRNRLKGRSQPEWVHLHIALSQAEPPA